MKIIYALIALFSLAFGQVVKAQINEGFTNVSMIQLIANPEKYHNKKIQVEGFLNLEKEGNAVYLHKEDYEQSLYENSFWVDFSEGLEKEKDIWYYRQKYVIIRGTFNMKDKGHMDLFGGTIKDIIRLDLWGRDRFHPVEVIDSTLRLPAK